MLEIAVGVLLVIVVAMFVLACEGRKTKPLAVSAANESAERDFLCRTCLRRPRMHCRRCQAGIWDRERQQGILRGGSPEIRIAGEIRGNLASSHATADPRRQGRSMNFNSDAPIADPYDAALKMLDIVRVSNRPLLDAGKIVDEYLETPRQPRDAKRTVNRLIAVLDTQELAAALQRVGEPDHRATKPENQHMR
jgi:hypothetical protein